MDALQTAMSARTASDPAAGETKWYDYSTKIERYLTTKKANPAEIDFYLASTPASTARWSSHLTSGSAEDWARPNHSGYSGVSMSR